MSADIQPITSLKLVDIRRKENEIRGAFSVDMTMGDYMHFNFRIPSNNPNASPFITIDKDTVNLNDLLVSLSLQMGLPKGGASEYGLLLDNRNTQGGGAKTFCFVTNEDLKSLKDGFLLIVTASPQKYAEKILEKLEKIDLFSGPTHPKPLWQVTLETLFSLSQNIAEIITKGSFESNTAALCRLFYIFLELMRHPGLLEWTQISPAFVDKISEYVNGRAKFENNESLRLSLSILLTILDKGGELETVVEEKCSFESLIRHLQKKETSILFCVLTLMNLLYNKVDDTDRISILQLIRDKAFLSAMENVIEVERKHPDDQIKEQLLLIQKKCFHQLGELAMRRPMFSEIDHVTEMSEWNYSSPNPSISEHAPTHDRHSMQGMAPTAKTKFADLVTLTPPGSLAIDVIVDYAQRYKKRLRDIQFESNLPSEVWPAIMAQIVTCLLQIFCIVPEKPDVPIWRMMFTAEQPFHDLFAVALDVFFRTWREMHANVDDEDKVLHVVRSQLALGIAENPASFKELDEIIQRKLSYFHMQKMWEKERMEREELELKSSAIRDLQQYLRPSIEELIKTKKKNILKKGFFFAKVSKGKSFNSDKKTYWFWKLDEHERCLFYTECLNSNSPTLKLDLKTKKKLAISDIKRIGTGSEYNETVVQQIGMKFSKKTALSFLKQGFSIELKDQSEHLALATDDEAVLQAWIEGLRLLLESEKLNEKEVNRLLDLEVRIRLLNVINPPANPPQIPALPKNFDWIPEKYRTPPPK